MEPSQWIRLNNTPDPDLASNNLIVQVCKSCWSGRENEHKQDSDITEMRFIITSFQATF